MRALVLGTVLSLNFLATAQSPAPAGLLRKDDALLRKVDDHYNHLSSLHARYTEHYTGMGMDRSESGTLLLKKPGRMAWHYDAPAGKLFIFNGHFAWFYTPGDAQAQKIPAKQMDDLHTPLRFLLGHTQLQKELDHITITAVGDQFRITGAPRALQQRIHELALQVTSSGLITGMRVEEIDGATTEFVFSEMQENVPAPDSDFTFTPPAGVTVITGPPPV